MTNIEKLVHWGSFLSFLGLAATALSANWLFSKEALMQSFEVSMDMLQITGSDRIAPADQLFMARIARREAWDVHFYFGIAFSLFLFVWLFMLPKLKLSKYMTLLLIGSVLAVTGGILYGRLFFELSPEAFSLTKKIHYYAQWTFVLGLIAHIAHVVFLENTKLRGIVSKTLSLKPVFIAVALIGLAGSYSSHAGQKTDRQRWLTDKAYVEGMMYLRGDKGYEVIEKQIDNCPYDNCEEADVDKGDMKNITTFHIKKPDYEKAVKLLNRSANKRSNPLAADQLLLFLHKRLNYKDLSPSGYLLKKLKEETGLTYKRYKKMMIKTAESGHKSKGCFSSYFLGQLAGHGYLGYAKTDPTPFFKKASETCPKGNFYKIMAASKLQE